MITKICNAVFKTDSLPLLGGASGALTQSQNLLWPTWEQVVYTIVIASIGAIVGYIIKLLLDWLLEKCKKNNESNNK